LGFTLSDDAHGGVAHAQSQQLVDELRV
jgi:hypothetical protein